MDKFIIIISVGIILSLQRSRCIHREISSQTNNKPLKRKRKISKIPNKESASIIATSRLNVRMEEREEEREKVDGKLVASFDTRIEKVCEITY